MKRTIVLGALVAAGAVSMTVAAYQQTPAAPKVVEVEKLKDNLFVLKGGGGNTAVFVQANGITVVDTKLPGWGQPILAKIKELSGKPVTTIINTHTHGDHVSGNVEFPATVDVVTHANTAANMKKMSAVSGLAAPPPGPTIFEQNQGRGLPKRTFTDKMSLGSGADQVDLYYFGRGHTNGDAWVIFPSLRIMHGGDIFSGKNLPLLDFNNGGSGVDIPDTLMKAYNAAANVDGIITGHSTVMTRADLREYSEFNRDFLNAVREAKKAGKSAEELVKSWTMPAKYAGYAAPAPARLQSNVQGIWNEVK
jgi:glyoxylase-like metal-dependent hydrolase (beta-lactamase superfamily II)